MCLQGSTVNMNIMGWVYSKVAQLVGSPGHTALGVSLMLGECYTLVLCRCTTVSLQLHCVLH